MGGLGFGQAADLVLIHQRARALLRLVDYLSGLRLGLGLDGLGVLVGLVHHHAGAGFGVLADVLSLALGVAEYGVPVLEHAAGLGYRPGHLALHGVQIVKRLVHIHHAQVLFHGHGAGFLGQYDPEYLHQLVQLVFFLALTAVLPRIACRASLRAHHIALVFLSIVAITHIPVHQSDSPLAILP